MNGKRRQRSTGRFFLGALAAALGLVLGIVMLLDGHVQAAKLTGPHEWNQVVLPAGSYDPAGVAIVGDSRQPPARTPTAAGDVIEVFSNTWAASTIGLVYDPARQQVRYAHEIGSSTSNPTVFDVEYLSHAVVSGLSLSAQNSGWPWRLDNRTGAGYDYVRDTYFLADYNGDLSYADDNLVEVDASGTILNAWEMDDSVGSNDSSDGTAIDNIVDIAVVPGSGTRPSRYFVTALYDGAVVYETALVRTGLWWTPNSWSTVMTYTVPLGDNAGIDYDAQNGVLYHSGLTTSTILVTDLDMNPIASFDCPGSQGYHSGLTFIEGAWPPEVWVTDYSSNDTTRCEAVGEPPVQPEWQKSVAGEPWDPDRVIVREAFDIVQVTDVITAVQPFTLTGSWDPDHLALIQIEISPPVATIISATASTQIVAPAGPPEVIQIDRWFAVQPCTWMTTTLAEGLAVAGGPAFAPRPVTIAKQPPQLLLESAYGLEAEVGTIVSYTLTYANNGGYENEISVSSAFPNLAPFVYAEPFPDFVSPDHLTAAWEVGDLAQGDAGNVAVYVYISDTVPASSTVSIASGIYNHVDELADETLVTFHAKQDEFQIDWEKFVNGEPWAPGTALTLETGETFLVEEIVYPGGNLTGFTLVEEWNPAELALLPTWTVEPADYDPYVTPADGFWLIEVPATVDHGPLVINKEFRVEPSTWPETILWEALEVWSGQTQSRPVVVYKEQPELWLNSTFVEAVYGGDLASFELSYGNNGGRESALTIAAALPPEAILVEADPPPTGMAEGWVEWAFPDGLERGEEGNIAVTVEIVPGLPVSATVEIWSGILNHVDELAAETYTTFHVPAPTWEKWVNGKPWVPDVGVTASAQALLTIVDVVTTRSALGIVEHWNPESLELVEVVPEPDAGVLTIVDGSVAWEFPDGAPDTIMLTKVFRVRPGPWSYSVLWEELWVGDMLWQRRPVQLDKMPELYLPVVRN